MNNEEIQKLKNLINDFENEDVYIQLENAVVYYTTIKKAKIIISNQKLIISDELEQDFIIELHYLDNVETDGNTIIINMSNDLSITLDY